MSSRIKYGVLFVVILVIALLVWFIQADSSSTVSGKNKIIHISSNWDEKYIWNSKDPYGLFILNDLLKDHLKKDSSEVITEEKQIDSLLNLQEKATFLYIGQGFGLYDNELDSILKMVEAGSDLVIVSDNMTANVSERFSPAISYRFDYNPTVKVQMGKENYSMVYLFQNDTLAYPWRIFAETDSMKKSGNVLSTISDEPNFIQFNHGNGRILLHSTPECFFNFQLARKDGFYYAEKVISTIDKNKTLHYLELARLDEDKTEEVPEKQEDEGRQDDSYLQFLFQTPALRAALFTLILGVFLFLLFRSKRMQPQVDVLPVKRNISEVFVQTIASIYRNRDNPQSVLLLHRKNFYHTIQKNFFIDLSRRTDHRELEHLSARCGVEKETIEKLLIRLETEDPKIVNEDFLLETSKLKREFYVQSGVINEKIQLRLDKRDVVLFRSVWISFPLILSGVLIILFGMYLLVQSKGVGILLWPLGSILVVWGIARINRPILKINTSEMNYYPLFGKSQKYAHSDILRAERDGSGIDIYYLAGRNLHLSFSEFNRRDRSQIEAFLIKQKVIEF